MLIVAQLGLGDLDVRGDGERGWFDGGRQGLGEEHLEAREFVDRLNGHAGAVRSSMLTTEETTGPLPAGSMIAFTVVVAEDKRSGVDRRFGGGVGAVGRDAEGRLPASRGRARR